MIWRTSKSIDESATKWCDRNKALVEFYVNRRVSIRISISRIFSIFRYRDANILNLKRKYVATVSDPALENHHADSIARHLNCHSVNQARITRRDNYSEYDFLRSQQNFRSRIFLDQFKYFFSIDLFISRIICFENVWVRNRKWHLKQMIHTKCSKY